MKNIILIDYENLQVKNLDDVYCLDTDVYVFRGPTQNKLPAELIESAQKFGSRITWIKTSRQGHNALDFHIAYFVGQIVQSDPKVFFHIVSKDDGFDALIDFMKERKLFIDRVESIEEIPLVKKMKAIESNPVAFIKDRILNVSSPSRLKTLRTAIAKWLEKDEEKLINGIVESLKKEKFLEIDAQGKVTYPKSR
jgi:hypothetical protein